MRTMQCSLYSFPRQSFFVSQYYALTVRLSVKIETLYPQDSIPTAPGLHKLKVARQAGSKGFTTPTAVSMMRILTQETRIEDLLPNSSGAGAWEELVPSLLDCCS